MIFFNLRNITLHYTTKQIKNACLNGFRQAFCWISAKYPHIYDKAIKESDGRAAKAIKLIYNTKNA